MAFRVSFLGVGDWDSKKPGVWVIKYEGFGIPSPENAESNGTSSGHETDTGDMGCSQNYRPLLVIVHIALLIFRGTKMGPYFWELPISRGLHPT